MHVGVAGEMLGKSSLQICSFRASPGLLGGVIIWNGTGRPAAAPWGHRASGQEGWAVFGSSWQCLAMQTRSLCLPSGHLQGVQGRRGMHWEGLIPAASAISKEIYGKCHPWFPGQMLFCFCRAARGVINCYCRESTECFSFNSKDVFNLPVALCKL